MAHDDSHARALKVADKYRSPRYREIERLEQYVLGTQYDGRPHFLAPGVDVPLLDRAPNIVAPIVEGGIRSTGDFVLGEGRFPKFVAATGHGLSDEDGAAINGCVDKLVEVARYRSLFREMLATAMGSRSVAVVCSVIDGRPTATIVPAKCCSATFDKKRPLVVTSLEIQYPYVECVKVDGEWRWVTKLYRRVIDAKTDTTFQPADARDDGAEPSWVPDSEQTFEHGLGFCPVVWYPFLKRCGSHGCDGEAVHERLLDEIDAYNFALSQRHRAALYCGDPQIVELGVDQHDGPSANGNAAIVERSSGYAFGLTARGTPARRKGPGNVWRYESPEADVKILTLPSDALKAIDDHARDLRGKIHEGLAVVDLDVENAKVADSESGKAREIAYRRQTDHCDIIRDDFGDNAMLPVVRMHLRIALAKPGEVRWPGLDAAFAALKRVISDLDIDLVWGPYFRPDDLAAQQAVEATSKAYAAGLLTRKVAIEKLRPYFPVHADDEILEALGVEEALSLKGMSLGSETADVEIGKRVLRTVLAGMPDDVIAKIESELARSAAHSSELREAMSENLGADREESDEGPASSGADKPQRGAFGRRASGRDGDGDAEGEPEQD